jgi:PEP-CTERM motif
MCSRLSLWLTGAKLSAGAAAISLASLISMTAANATVYNPYFFIAGGTTTALPGDFGAFNTQAYGTNAGGPSTDTLTTSDGNTIGIGTKISEFFSSGGGLVLGGFASGSNVALTFTFLGFEAGDTDTTTSFDYALGSDVVDFINQSTPPGTSTTAQETLPGPPALLPFTFTNQSVAGENATNGGPIDSGTGIGFLVDPTNDAIAYAFFDDSGAGPDGDFDDMVVEIQVAAQITGGGEPTPLPGTLTLFAAGLGLLGLATAWRKRRKDAPMAFATA